MLKLRSEIIHQVRLAGEPGIRVTDLASVVGALIAPLGKAPDGTVRVSVCAGHEFVEVWTRAGVIVRVKAA